MNEEDRGDREVPLIDFHTIEALARVVRQGHSMRDVADKFHHWGMTVLRVLDGSEAITERLSEDRRTIVVDELIARAVESAKGKPTSP